MSVLIKRGWTELDGLWWKETFAVPLATALAYELFWATDFTDYTRY